MLKERVAAAVRGEVIFQTAAVFGKIHFGALKILVQLISCTLILKERKQIPRKKKIVVSVDPQTIYGVATDYG